MTRAQLLERYQALPFPTTSDEHWRFTDLKGFDPDSFSANGAKTVERAGSMLDVETAALAHVSEAGIEIERAPEGVVFEPLTEKHELLGTLVGTDEKFAAHNAAEWKHGLLVRVPAGLELQQPLYVRVTSSVPEAALFWRVLVVAEEGSRFSFIEEHASAARDLPGYSNVVAELFVGDGAKLEYVSIQNLSQETWHFASHHRRPRRRARLGGRRLRLEEGQDSDRERPGRARRDLARDRRLLRRRCSAPRLRHAAEAHRAEHDLRLRLQGRPPGQGEGGLAVDDPRRGGRAEDERLSGEPQPAPFARRTRGLDPRPRDRGERRPLHARRNRQPGQPGRAFLLHGPRALTRRGRAPDRARLLPGDLRPHRARAGADRAPDSSRSAHPRIAAGPSVP